MVLLRVRMCILSFEAIRMKRPTLRIVARALGRDMAGDYCCPFFLVDPLLIDQLKGQKTVELL